MVMMMMCSSCGMEATTQQLTAPRPVSSPSSKHNSNNQSQSLVCCYVSPSCSVDGCDGQREAKRFGFVSSQDSLASRDSIQKTWGTCGNCSPRAALRAPMRHKAPHGSLPSRCHWKESEDHQLYIECVRWISVTSSKRRAMGLVVRRQRRNA